MEIEELNKSQVVLLTLLVSFVTSIATGIVTVSLMEQAPADVTRVIQKTVERTIEKVAPPEIQTKIITKEKTVIVSDSDLIATAVELNTPSVVRIYTLGEAPEFVALGVVISAGGVVATDASKITDDTEYAVHSQSSEYSATVLRTSSTKQIALLELTDTTTVPRPASISASRTKLGSSAVLLSGLDKITVAQGLVTELGTDSFATNLDSDGILPGAILINIDGNVVGISTAASRESGGSWFVPARSILALLKAPESGEESGGETSSATTTNETQQAAAAGALNKEQADTTTE